MSRKRAQKGAKGRKKGKKDLMKTADFKEIERLN